MNFSYFYMDLSGDSNMICGMNVNEENDIKIIHLLVLYAYAYASPGCRSIGRHMNEWWNEKWMKRNQARHFPVNAHWIFIDIECGLHGISIMMVLARLGWFIANRQHHQPNPYCIRCCYTKTDNILTWIIFFANACFPSTHSVHSRLLAVGDCHQAGV